MILPAKAGMTAVSRVMQFGRLSFSTQRMSAAAWRRVNPRVVASTRNPQSGRRLLNTVVKRAIPNANPLTLLLEQSGHLNYCDVFSGFRLPNVHWTKAIAVNYGANEVSFLGFEQRGLMFLMFLSLVRCQSCVIPKI
jgi:hypothetical protein